MLKILFILGLSLISQSGFAAMTLSNDVFDNSNLPFVSHAGTGRTGSYLSMEIKFSPVLELYKQVQSEQKKSLLNRGEAHITVVTPLEYFDVLKPQGVLISEIDSLAKNSNIQSAGFEVVCVGRGSAAIDKKTEETFYVVVKSEDLVSLRSKIQELFVSKGGNASNFNPQNYYPHITLGFTKRDLHESDGVIKDSRTCLYDVQLK